MARLVAFGHKPPHLHTRTVTFALGDEEWHPRNVLESIQEFDPDAHNKEQEEAYGPDDVR